MPGPSLIFSFNIIVLWLSLSLLSIVPDDDISIMTTTCMLKVLPVSVYLITLLRSEQLFEVWKILPATLSNGKQNIQFQNKIHWQ